MLQIKKLLKERGITQKGLAKQLGMTEIGLSVALSENGNPSISRLQQIADTLGVHITDLFEPKTDFTAFVKINDVVKAFGSIKDLRSYLDTLEG